MSEPKAPQDHKSPVESFTWTAADGRSVTLKPFSRIPAGVFRKIKGLDELEATFSLIESATDDEGLSVIDDIPIGDLDQLFNAWSSASGAELPQS